MFKNYLTYQFVLAVESGCNTIEISGPRKLELRRCAAHLVEHFARTLREGEPACEPRSLFVALMYLRDCRDLLDAEEAGAEDLRSRLHIVEGRLLQLCEEAASASERAKLIRIG